VANILTDNGFNLDVLKETGRWLKSFWIFKKGLEIQKMIDKQNKCGSCCKDFQLKGLIVQWKVDLWMKRFEQNFATKKSIEFVFQRFFEIVTGFMKTTNELKWIEMN